MFTRALQPIPTTRRAYSSFFSSKPGGGRFFNSTKPPKTLVNAAKSKPDNTHAASDGAVSGSGSASGSGSSKLKTTAGEEASHERPPPAVTNGAATRDRPSQTSHNASASSTMTAPLRLTSPPSTSSSHILPRHPLMSPEEYKLHQFFSLHRPLLLHA